MDTESKENYVSEDRVDVKDAKEIPKFEITVANGQLQKIEKQANIKFSLLQIPRTTFFVKACVIPKIPADLILGLNFLE